MSEYKKTEVGTADTVTGVYYFNERHGKWQIDIDCIDFDLVDESFHFDSKEEMQKEINKKYNVNLKF